MVLYVITYQINDIDTTVLEGRNENKETDI